MYPYSFHSSRGEKPLYASEFPTTAMSIESFGSEKKPFALGLTIPPSAVLSLGANIYEEATISTSSTHIKESALISCFNPVLFIIIPT